MKNSKKLLMVAMAFALMFIGLNKVQAQTNNVPVILESRGESTATVDWTYADWTITLHNNTTSQDTVLYTSTVYNPSSYLDYDGWHVGFVAPGDYSVTVSYDNGSVTSDHFDYFVNGNYGPTAVQIYSYTDTLLFPSIGYVDGNLSNPNATDYQIGIHMLAY